MPHPDYRIVDVPLRLDQIAALLRAASCRVANSPNERGGSLDGAVLGLVGSLPPGEGDHYICESSYVKGLIEDVRSR